MIKIDMFISSIANDTGLYKKKWNKHEIKTEKEIEGKKDIKFRATYTKMRSREIVDHIRQAVLTKSEANALINALLKNTKELKEKGLEQFTSYLDLLQDLYMAIYTTDPKSKKSIPKESPFEFEMAKILLDKGDVEGAKKYASKLLESNPKEAEIIYTEILKNTQDLEAAAKLEAALKSQALDKVSQLVRQNKIKEEEADFLKGEISEGRLQNDALAKLIPHMKPGMANALVLIQKGNVKEAKKCADKALSNNDLLLANDIFIEMVNRIPVKLLKLLVHEGKKEVIGKDGKPLTSDQVDKFESNKFKLDKYPLMYFLLNGNKPSINVLEIYSQ